MRPDFSKAFGDELCIRGLLELSEELAVNLLPTNWRIVSPPNDSDHFQASSRMIG